MALLHPDSDLSLSVVAQGADIIRTLHHAKKDIILDQALEKYLRNDTRRTPQSFFATLDFLFTIGAIDTVGYHLSLIKNRSREVRQQENYDLFEDDNAS
jgi:hypothetical protein